MSVNLKSETIPASGVTLLEGANFCFILNLSAAINLNFQPLSGFAAGSAGAGNEIFTGMPAGFYIKRIKGWGKCIVTGTPGTTFSLFYGYEVPREDDTGFQTQIAVISGSVLVTPSVGSPNIMTNHADVVVPTVTIDTTITANAARKALVVGSKSTNAPGAGLNLRLQGGAGSASQLGIELQPGMSFTFQGTFPVSVAAYAVYNPAAVSQTYWWAEQT